MSPRRAELFARQRRAVLIRCGGRCEKCGQALREVWECHHRKLRSQGGDDSLSNLLALHMTCHNAGETGSVHHSPGVAYELGYLVRSHRNPEEQPVHLYGKRWVLLSPLGTYQPFPPITFTPKEKP